jgi:nucleoside-diphosphate-sugar epimerase
MRVLVTGAAGFIGGHLAAAAAIAGHVVLGLDKRAANGAGEFESVTCDLLDRPALVSAVARFRPDAILHLAARTDLDETQDIRAYAANIDGVTNLLAAIREAGSVQRVVCTSSQLVHPIGYRAAHDQDYGETTTLYGRSKVETERLWRDADGADTTWCLARPTTIWGPRMNPHYVRWLGLIREGRYYHLSARPTRKSYGFVGNTVHQYLQLLTVPADRIHRRMFYLADYEPIALEDWADAFARELGARPIRSLPLAAGRLLALAGDVLQAVGFRRIPLTSFRLNNIRTPFQVDLSATESVCGPLPYTMEDGVRLTAEWVRGHWAAAPA